MQVGLDSIPLAAAKTGVGHYTYELACALARVAPEHGFDLISPFPLRSSVGESDAAAALNNLRLVRVKCESLQQRWWKVGLPAYVAQTGLDLFHGTNYCVPLWGGCRTVMTIHDLTLYLYPETYQQHVLQRMRHRLPVMARTANLIITPSESVRREVCEHLPVEPSKVIAIPEAARPIFRRASREQIAEVRRRLDVAEEFILFVGTIEPRKNLLMLVRAFEEVLKETSSSPQLVIAGGLGWQNDDLYAHIAKAGIGDRVRFTGYVSDEDLCALYSSCRACVYPSLYEGFGLPPLEAMACGAPVITSRIASIVETVGDAARLVAPDDMQSLTRAILDLLRDEAERRHFAVAGRARAAEFTWEKTARATLEVYNLALAKERSRFWGYVNWGGGRMARIHNPDVTVETLADKIREGTKQTASTSTPAESDDPVPLSIPSHVERAPATFSDSPTDARSSSVQLNYPTLVLQPEFRPDPEDHYHVNDLAQYHDHAFIENAYRAILKRLPNTADFNHHLDNLRLGNIDKIEVLMSIRYSPEGQAAGVRIDGLWLPALMRRIRNLPIIGYFAQFCAGLVRLPRIVTRQRQLEAQIFAQQQQIIDHYNARLAEISAAHAHVNEALGQPAGASETMTALQQQGQTNDVEQDLEAGRKEMRARVVEPGGGSANRERTAKI